MNLRIMRWGRAIGLSFALTTGVAHAGGLQPGDKLDYGSVEIELRSSTEHVDSRGATRNHDAHGRRMSHGKTKYEPHDFRLPGGQLTAGATWGGEYTQINPDGKKYPQRRDCVAASTTTTASVDGQQFSRVISVTCENTMAGKSKPYLTMTIDYAVFAEGLPLDLGGSFENFNDSRGKVTWALQGVESAGANRIVDLAAGAAIVE